MLPIMAHIIYYIEHTYYINRILYDPPLVIRRCCTAYIIYCANILHFLYTQYNICTKKKELSNYYNDIYAKR